MKFLVENGQSILKMNLITTVLLAITLLHFGIVVQKKVGIFNKFCIPAPVIGGLFFSLLAFIFKETNLINFKMDLSLQEPLMVAFFTTVGFGGSFSLLKKGGIILIIYWGLSAFLSIMQNIIGVSIASIMGINPIYGVLSGAVSMIGGHAAAAAFGSSSEIQLGLHGAKEVALAAATFGLVSGSLIGGPIAKYLITKNKLKPTVGDYAAFEDIVKEDKIDINYKNIMFNSFIILLTMFLGELFGQFLSNVIAQISNSNKIALPSYVGAMFVAVAFRNLNDRYHFCNISFKIINLISDVSLGLFLSMALMSLKLWQLKGLGVSITVIVLAEVLFIGLYTIFVVFKLIGKDYDAAVMVAGMCGHGLGAVPNAIANMTVITEKYGPSPKAFLIVPIVGSFLVDLIHIPNILVFMNIFG